MNIRNCFSSAQNPFRIANLDRHNATLAHGVAHGESYGAISEAIADNLLQRDNPQNYIVS